MDLEERIGKQKAELSLMQSNQQIHEEKLKNISDQVNQKLAEIATQKEDANPKEDTTEVRKQIGSLIKSIKAL